MKRDKIIRLMAGALLSSDLSYQQLLEVSDRLKVDREWLEEISVVIRELAEVARRGGRRSFSRPEDASASGHESDVGQIIDMVNRKRMRRSAALEILAELSESHGKPWTPNTEWTLRRNVDDLLRRLSPRDSRIMMKQLSEVLGIPSDAYLRELL